MIMKNIHILPTDKPSRLGYLTKKGKEVYKDLRLFEKLMPIILDSENQNIYITNDEVIKEGDWYFDGANLVHKKTKYNDALVDGNKQAKKIILTTDQELIKNGIQAIDDEFLEWFVKNPSCEFVEVLKYKSNNMCKMNLGYKIILPKEEPKTAWVGVLHDKLNEYYPAEYELKDIYQGEGCLPNFPNEELCQIWCDSKYKEEPNYNMKQEILDEMKKQETLEEAAERTEFERYGETLTNYTKQRPAYNLGFNNGAKWQQQNRYSGEDMKQFGDWCRNGLLNTEYGFEKLDEHLEQWKQLKNK